MHAHLLHMPIIQCNFHPFTFYLPFHTSSLVDQCPIYAPSNCTMGLDTCARHSLFGRTDPYYTVILYSSCGLNKRPAATLAFLLSVSVLFSQYLFQPGPIWFSKSSIDSASVEIVNTRLALFSWFLSVPIGGNRKLTAMWR